MAISPIEFSGTLGAQDNLSHLKANEDNRAAILHGNAHIQVEHEAVNKLNRVREADDVSKEQKGFNASEKGDNEYQGDGGRNRRKKEREGQVVVKSKGGFDISV